MFSRRHMKTKLKTQKYIPRIFALRLPYYRDEARPCLCIAIQRIVFVIRLHNSACVYTLKCTIVPFKMLRVNTKFN